MALSPDSSEKYLAQIWWRSKDYLKQQSLIQKHGGVRNSIYIGPNGLRGVGEKSIIYIYRREKGL